MSGFKGLVPDIPPGHRIFLSKFFVIVIFVSLLHGPIAIYLLLCSYANVHGATARCHEWA